MKKCAKKYQLSGADLLNLVRQQEEDQREQPAARSETKRQLLIN